MALERLMRRTPPPLVGVDIGGSSIRLVELGRTPRGEWLLQRYAIEPLGAHWVVDGTIEKSAEVSQALRRLLQRCGTRAKDVALALPYGMVITRRVAMPVQQSEQEREFQVEGEIVQLVPFAMTDVTFDFCALGEVPETALEQDVLITATRLEKVQERLDVAEAVGLRPRVVDVEAFAALAALERVLPVSAGAAPQALVRVGTASINLHIMQGENTIYNVDEPISLGLLSQMVADHYGISAEEAHSRRIAGDLPADYQEVVLRPYLQSLAQDIVRAVQFFFNTTSYQRLERIVLCGDLHAAVELVASVQAGTAVTTLVPNPFEGMVIAPEVDAASLRREASACLTACGLAMRRFDA